MNIQEKSVQLESKQLQLIAKVKDLSGAFEQENEQRRLIDLDRKKDVNDNLDVSRGSLSYEDLLFQFNVDRGIGHQRKNRGLKHVTGKVTEGLQRVRRAWLGEQD